MTGGQHEVFGNYRATAAVTVVDLQGYLVRVGLDVGVVTPDDAAVGKYQPGLRVDWAGWSEEKFHGLDNRSVVFKWTHPRQR